MLIAPTDVVGWPGHAAAFAAGVGLHLSLFRQGEWDLQATRLVVSTFAVFAATSALMLYLVLPEIKGMVVTPNEALRHAGRLVGLVLTGVFSNMLLYRAFFHRLRQFPGPFMARLSNFWITYKGNKNMRKYEEIQKLHHTYGDYVRIAPSELSINDPEAVALLHAASSPCVKGPWYNALHPDTSLQVERDPKRHAERRRSWDRAFSSKALRDYQPRVARITGELLQRVAEHTSQGRPMDVSRWFNYYSFDVMGAMTYSKSFNMLKSTGETHYFLSYLRLSMEKIGQFSHLMWLFPLFKETPIINAGHKAFQKFLQGEVEERRKITPDEPDVFGWVIQAYDDLPNPTRKDRTDLYADAYLITVAGSDTTSSTLTCLLFELTLHPNACAALRRELDDFASEQAKNGASEYDDLHKLKYLQACVNEALRLHPAVPGGVQRFTPPGGLQIGDRWVPGNTIVQVPSHTMYRDERLFPQPTEFIPERWTTEKHLVKDASIFVPFSTGPYSCVGKNLALMEIRYVISQLVRQYNFALSPSQTPETFLREKKDVFTLDLGKLEIDFAPREKA